jgi:hypothetical protein
MKFGAQAVLRIRCLFDPWIQDPGWIKKSRSGMKISDIFLVKILKFFDANADPGYGNLFDPGSGMEKFGSGINIPDLQHRPQGLNVSFAYCIVPTC